MDNLKTLGNSRALEPDGQVTRPVHAVVEGYRGRINGVNLAVCGGLPGQRGLSCESTRA